jgi:hypothetical protein
VTKGTSSVKFAKKDLNDMTPLELTRQDISFNLNVWNVEKTLSEKSI